MKLAVFAEVGIPPTAIAAMSESERKTIHHAHCVLEYHGGGSRGLLSSVFWEKHLTTNGLPCKITVGLRQGVGDKAMTDARKQIQSYVLNPRKGYVS